MPDSDSEKSIYSLMAARRARSERLNGLAKEKGLETVEPAAGGWDLEASLGEEEIELKPAFDEAELGAVERPPEVELEAEERLAGGPDSSFETEGDGEDIAEVLSRKTSTDDEAELPPAEAVAMAEARDDVSLEAPQNEFDQETSAESAETRTEAADPEPEEETALETSAADRPPAAESAMDPSAVEAVASDEVVEEPGAEDTVIEAAAEKTSGGASGGDEAPSASDASVVGAPAFAEMPPTEDAGETISRSPERDLDAESEEASTAEERIAASESLLDEEPPPIDEAEVRLAAEELVDRIGPIVDLQKLPKTKPSRVLSKAAKAAEPEGKAEGPQGPAAKTPVAPEAEAAPARDDAEKGAAAKELAKPKKKRVTLLDSYFKGL